MTVDPDTGYNTWVKFDSLDLYQQEYSSQFPVGFVPDGIYRLKSVGRFISPECEDPYPEDIVIISDGFYMEILSAEVSPNPFNPEYETAEIKYELSEGATVSIQVYKSDKITLIRDICKDVFQYGNTIRYEAVEQGQGIFLIQKQTLKQILHNEYFWDGRDNTGSLVSAGLYKIKLSAYDPAGNATEQWLEVNLNYSKHPPASEPPVISNVEDSPDPFSPNGDGIKDFVRIYYTVYGASETVKVWLKIKNTAGDIEKTLLDGVEQANGSYYIDWDGCGDTGQVLPDGMYYYEIRAQNTIGSNLESVYTGEVTIDRTPPIISLTKSSDRFSPNSDGCKDDITFEYSVSDNTGIEQWQLRIERIAYIHKLQY